MSKETKVFFDNERYKEFLNKTIDDQRILICSLRQEIDAHIKGKEELCKYFGCCTVAQVKNKFDNLKQQLEEKDKEIENLKNQLKNTCVKYHSKCAICEKQLNKEYYVIPKYNKCVCSECYNKKAIEELEKVKNYWNWYKNTKFKEGCLFDRFLELCIKELKGEK